MLSARLIPVGLALVLPLMTGPAAQAQPGTAKGTLAVNGKKLTIQHVSAVSYDTPNLGRLVSVLLADKPANPKTFQEYTRIGPGERYVPGMISGAWVTMHVDDKAFSGFHFTLDGKGRPILGEVLIGAREDNFGLMDDVLVFEPTAATPRVAGRIRTREPVTDLGSQKVGIDVTFDAAVVAVGK